MFRLLIIILSFTACFIFSAAAGDKPQWMTRPIEIIENKIERRPASIRIKDQDLSKWNIVKAENISGARLELSGDYQLWEDQVAKLSFTIDDVKQPGQIDLAVNPPLTFPESDYIEFWVNGPTLFHGYFVANFISADKVSSRIEVVGGGHQWHRSSFWGTALTAKRPSGKPPWQLTKLEITIKPAPGAEAGRSQAIYFDEFAIAKKDLSKLPVHWRDKYPQPTTPDTILPAAKNPAISHQVRKNAEAYEFTYKDGEKQVSYLYTPQTGTLSDLVIRLGDGTEFQVTRNGGVVADVNGVSIKPDSPGVKAELIQCDLQGETLKTVWKRSNDKASITYAMDFTIKQKSLIVTASSKEPMIERFEFGTTDNTPGVKLVPVSFWDYRWAVPYVMSANGVFVTGIVDWYKSNASGIFDDGNDQRRFVGPTRLDADHVRITGGSDYRKLSDGSRNCLYDRIFITVSDDFDEVLPTLANPKSPRMTETARYIYCSRPNILTSPEAAEEEVVFWTKLKAYGMDDMFVRYHSEVMRTPLESNRFGRSDEAYKGLGDEALIKMIKGIQALGHKVGIYGDEQLLHGLAPQYDISKIALDYAYRPHQRWYFNNYLARPYVQIQHAADFIPGFQKKFGWDGIYSDEVTNTPPWGHTDYEAGVPGAGKFTEVLYGYMLLLEVNRKLYNGPVWSEGTAHYFWAGYTDMNYAQSNRPDNPIIVNFQLSQLHTRQNDIGYELAAGKPWSIDFWLASTVIFGNMGSLIPRDGAPSMIQGPPEWFPEHGNLAKCYFMMRALQELYSGQTAAEIRYADDRGVLYNTSDAVRRDIIANNMVYVKYANGLETWVNRHQEKSWTIDFNGAKLLLPPNGYAALLNGKILEYSAGAPRVDYVESALYCYADGRGTRTEFPSLTASGAYMWRPKDNGIEFIPQHPAKTETVVLKNVKSVQEITALDAKGRTMPIRPEFSRTPSGIELKIRPDVFKYQIVTIEKK